MTSSSSFPYASALDSEIFDRFNRVVKAYDIRGTTPDQFDADMARALGYGFAKNVPSSEIVIARDMRPSGIELVGAFIAGAQAGGARVIEIGLASTDLLYYATGLLNIPGAMFTASHNPAAYNGIKMCLAQARPIGIESGLAEIRDTAISYLTGKVDIKINDTAEADEHRELLDQFADHVRSFANVATMKPFRVIADCANGMGGLVAPAVFAKLPIDLELLYPELDGTFPNHPADPINADNLRDLQKRVLETGADVGLAFDGDADRVFLVDNKAQLVSGSLTTAMVAKALLNRATAKGAKDVPVLHNVICSKAVPEVIRENGGVPIRTRVGHSFIKKVMAETGAIFGGEHSGHYYFADNFNADSGIIAAIVVLGMMSESDMPLSDMRKPFDRYAASGEINTEVADPLAVIEHVAQMFADASLDRLDGLTVDLGDWWFNLRPSNTEPLLRLNLEAANEAECAARTAEILAIVRA